MKILSLAIGPKPDKEQERESFIHLKNSITKAILSNLGLKDLERLYGQLKQSTMEV
jgi:hypothetical protein